MQNSQRREFCGIENIGNAGSHLFGDSPKAHKDTLFGDVEARISGALKANVSFDENRAAVTRSVEDALTEIVQEKTDRLHETHEKILQEVKPIGIILAEVEPARVDAQAFRIKIKTLTPISFDTIDTGSKVQEAVAFVGGGVYWSASTPKAGTSTRDSSPNATSIEDSMQAIVDITLEPYKKWVGPPFVIAELKADGIHWLKNADVHRALLFIIGTYRIAQ
jgi:hypothetical protein